jgi:hypothetical protein
MWSAVRGEGENEGDSDIGFFYRHSFYISLVHAMA